MPSPVASAALAAALLLTPVAAGHAPARSQDFSITNQREPADTGRRDLVRQLQAWWDVHAYYPRRASSADESGTVKLHVVILPDGRVGPLKTTESSGSASLDTAAIAAFRGGFVQPFAEGAPEAALDLSLHYVLAHRHDEPVATSRVSTASKRPFTIMNDPVTSPILETMLQRTCTGTVVKEGIRNHPAYGGRHQVQAVFFRRPEDGTPWVKFYDGGEPLLAPVNQVGKQVQWTGRTEHTRRAMTYEYQYTVWSEGADKLSGNIEAYFFANSPEGINTGGTVDLTCETQTVPAITWSALAVRTIQAPPGDPP